MRNSLTSLLVLCSSMFFVSEASAQIATPAVKSDFEARRTTIDAPEYFKIFDRTDLTDKQREALEVLYAYMPLPDITDRTGEYFLENVDVALRGREELPWGKIVPDREFRHFVLPVRINNEALDGHRKVFYEELLPRIKDMSMEEAILEINHWCHEKATYQPSDGRTHSPLLTVYTAIGRCGEESTFTVAALRAMGIPARQVYTPRWAHTDDNHAWVEAWADGKWHFLGACEPEAVLDLGWFNAPAARGMLMNTRVFGHYDGPEEVLMRLDGYTDINVTPNYAPTDVVNVTVTDTNGKPLENVNVAFRIYNYAELFPLASKTTDKDGRTSLLTGLGDLIVWANDKDGNYSFTKAKVGTDKNVTLTLGPDAPKCQIKGSEGLTSIDIDIAPPVAAARPVKVPEELAAINVCRFAYEDSVRGAYTATFGNAQEAAALASQLGLDADRLTKVIVESRGNHGVVTEFLTSLPAADRERGLRLLEVIAMKDRSDMALDVLRDHMLTIEGQDSPLYVEYVLNPRVDNEMVEPYRAFFRSHIPAADAARYRSNPQLWVNWVRDNIDATRKWYPSNVVMLPTSVWNYRRTTPLSRDVFFTAAARAMGIPAQIDPINGKPMWADASGTWHEALFNAPEGVSASPAGTIALTYTPTGRIDDPKYYTHFSLASVDGGQPTQLTYPDFIPWSEVLATPNRMDEGDYILITGQRMADGGVLAHMEILPVKANENVTAPITMRQDPNGVQVIGSFDAETIYHDEATGTDKSVLSTTGRGYYILGVIRPGHEPSNHALRDIAALGKELEAWGRPMILLFANADEASRYDGSLLPELPSTVVFGTDNAQGTVASSLIENLKLDPSDRPIFVIADTFNRVVFLTQGYTIGLGEQLIDTIHKLKE